MISTIAATLIVSASVTYHPANDSIRAVRATMVTQKRAIIRGTRTGELTRGERRLLQRKHKRLSKKFRRYLRDRRFTRSERRRMFRALNFLSARIQRYSTNRIRRYDRRFRRYVRRAPSNYRVRVRPAMRTRPVKVYRSKPLHRARIKRSRTMKFVI